MSDLTNTIGDLIEFRAKSEGQPMSVEQMAVVRWTLQQAEGIGAKVRPENAQAALQRILEEERIIESLPEEQQQELAESGRTQRDPDETYPCW